MDLETKKYELDLILKNILTIGEVDEQVSKELEISVSMLNKVKSGLRWNNNPVKLQNVINAYRKIYNNQNEIINS